MTVIIDDFKAGWNIIFHPDENTAKKMSIGDAFAFYYKFSIIPMLFLVAMIYISFSIVFAIIGSMPTYGQYLTPFKTFGMLGAIALVLVWLWVFIPIGILIQAALYQLLGGALMGKFKGGYSGTVTAVIFASFPSLMVAWLGFIPVLGGIISIIFGLYSIYVLVTALANQHKTTKGTAFLVWLIWAIIAVVIVFAIVFFAVAVFGTAILHSLGGAMGAPGYGVNVTGYNTTGFNISYP